MIDKIKSIKDYRSFRDFKWDSSLKGFKEFNLIYGWNGSGKSTLSTILRSLETGKDYNSTGSFEIEFSGDTITEKTFKNRNDLQNKIRVFNADYVRENIFKDPNTSDLNPIWTMGKDSIDINKQIKIAETEKSKLEKQRDLKVADIRTLTNEFGDMESEIAYAIKSSLRSSGLNDYANYNKSKIHNEIKIISSDTRNNDKKPRDYLLTRVEYDELTRIINQEKREKISEIKMPTSVSEFIEFKISVTNILESQVVRRTINRLDRNNELANWVDRGYSIHKRDGLKICEFCGNEIPSSRMEELEDYFNKEYQELTLRIDEALRTIDNYEKHLFEERELTPLVEFNLKVRDQFRIHKKEFEKSFDRHSANLKYLKEKLQLKRDKLNEIIYIDVMDSNNVKSNLSGINKQIQIHNRLLEHHHKHMLDSAEKLKLHYIARNFDRYEQKSSKLKQEEKSLEELKRSLESKSLILSKLYTKIKSFKPMANELSKGLEYFLGHKEIKIEPVEASLLNNYIIIRGEEPAEHLSEGEKNALALVYFLTTLKDIEFSKKGIVVIDDPVSSFDSNSLYYACEFISDRMKSKNIQQLILLTHNYYFFRRFRKMFDTKVREYTLECYFNNKIKAKESILKELDPLLRDYDSEYQYLFKKVYDAATKDDGEPLELFYSIPNISRRLLESFLSFKLPNRGKEKKFNIKGSLDCAKIQFDKSKKVKIAQFVNPNSHMDRIDDIGSSNLDLLKETPQIMRDILGLIYKNDELHFRGMIKAINEDINTLNWLDCN